MDILGSVKAVLGAGHAAANSAPNQAASKDDKGTTIFDRITKWSNNRKVNSSKGANDLSSAGMADPQSAKKGAMVKKTGLMLVHKGEQVLTKKQQTKKKMTKRGPRKSA
ncbi:MAG: hypothetical protein ACREJN_21385 [Nitrospiraceae bacterium]